MSEQPIRFDVEASIALAERVPEVLHRHAVDAVVIGGFALAEV